uniref:G-protein coupled receptors family 1 profile domain-containing protein n=1 Tax=Ciona savignyi TaxID=51511 RepID=H2YG05_CIOSA
CIPIYQICNGVAQCSDESDELNCTCKSNEVSNCRNDTKCIQRRQVLDGSRNCADGSDEPCLHGTANTPGLNCLHRLLHSKTQVCDGIIDCEDLSDECLSNRMNVSMTQIHSAINGASTDSFVQAVRQWMNAIAIFFPLCSYGFDEVNCTNRHYCKQSTSISIDKSRTCNGVIDCEDSSDEMVSLCASKRFYCASKVPLSIDRTLVEDGIKDCSDGSDECPINSTRNTLFSSQSDMIGNSILRTFFWIMGLSAIIGNTVVIVTTISKLKNFSKNSATKNNNCWLVINLAISDCLMGVYLISVSIKGAQFHGKYCYLDLDWRTSSSCSLLGSLALLSTETSIFIMTIMTTQRVFAVFRPIESMNSSFGSVVIPTFVAWLCGLFIAVLPLFESDYFILSAWYPNRFY